MSVATRELEQLYHLYESGSLPAADAREATDKVRARELERVVKGKEAGDGRPK